MKAWIPWLLSVALVTALAFAGPSVSGTGGCTTCVQKAGDTMTGTLTSSVLSGSNAFALSNNGARIDFGSGADDYLSSDGTNLNVGRGLSGANILVAHEMWVASSAGLFLNTAGTHRIYDVDDASGVNVNAAFSVAGDVSTALAVNAHGMSIHDTGIGGEGGLHLTQGDDATAFIPFLRPTANDLPLVFGGGRTPDGASFNPIAYSATSGYDPELQIISTVSPASGSGTFSSLEITPTVNGVSSGTYAALVIDPIVTAFTGGAVLLADFGTTSSTYTSGYTSKFKIDTGGNTTVVGAVSAASFIINGVTVITHNQVSTNFSTPAGDTDLQGGVADSAGAVAVGIGNTASLTGAGEKIVGFYSDNFQTLAASIDDLGYLASTTPVTLGSVYVNTIWTDSTGTANFFVYGRQVLPAHAFTMKAIQYGIRTPGAGGTGTNATFQATDGTNTCNCAFACNEAENSYRTTCSSGGGTGCAFPASANLIFRFNGHGDCTTNSDILGNIMVEGIWQ